VVMADETHPISTVEIDVLIADIDQALEKV
jgi:hypothetical protein